MSNPFCEFDNAQMLSWLVMLGSSLKTGALGSKYVQHIYKWLILMILHIIVQTSGIEKILTVQCNVFPLSIFRVIVCNPTWLISLMMILINQNRHLVVYSRDHLKKNCIFIYHIKGNQLSYKPTVLDILLAAV